MQRPRVEIGDVVKFHKKWNRTTLRDYVGVVVAIQGDDSSDGKCKLAVLWNHRVSGKQVTKLTNQDRKEIWLTGRNVIRDRGTLPECFKSTKDPFKIPVTSKTPVTTGADSKWNTTCTRCGAPAYQGFFDTECSKCGK